MAGQGPSEMTAEERAAWAFFWEVFGNSENREMLRYLITNAKEMKRLLEASDHERH